VWEEIAEDAFRGLGQRVIATDVDDIPLLEVRSIVLTPAVDEEAAAPVADDHG